MFLVFIDGADDAACYPASRLRGMTVAANATIKMQFEASIGDPDGSNVNTDLVTLTCTADTEKDVMLAIAKQLEKGGTLLVADDVASVYCHKDITGCAITLDV
jgi:hypothetical protein